MAEKSISYKNLQGVIDFLRGFDIERSKKLANNIRKHKLYLTGMGSSFFFPAKFARDRAIRLGVENPIVALPSSELLRTNYFGVGHIIISSLSGKTRENIYLLELLLSQKFLSITTISYNATTPLIKRTNRHLYLDGKMEKGILKPRGILNIALVLDSLIMQLAINQRRGFDVNKANEDLKLLAEQSANIIDSDKEDEELINLFLNAKQVVVIGPDNGLGDEVCISGVKLLRKPFYYISGTNWLHYMEEANEKDVLILALFMEEWDRFMDDIIERLSEYTDMVVSVGYKSYDDGIMHIPLNPNKTFKTYLALIRLWKLFLSISDKITGGNIDEYKHYNPFRNVYTG